METPVSGVAHLGTWYSVTTVNIMSHRVTAPPQLSSGHEKLFSTHMVTNNGHSIATCNDKNIAACHIQLRYFKIFAKLGTFGGLP